MNCKKCKHDLIVLSKGGEFPNGYVSPIFKCKKCKKLWKQDIFDDLVEVEIE